MDEDQIDEEMFMQLMEHEQAYRNESRAIE